MAALVLAVVVVGFGRTFFYAPFMALRPIRPYLYLHATVFSLWVLLFVLQVAFISMRRTDLHRRMGLVGACIAALLVIVGTLTIIESVRHQDLQAGSINLFGSGAQLLLFAILVTAGLWHRHRPDVHKRLMLVGTLALAQAGLGRILQGMPPGLHMESLLNVAFMSAWVFHDLLTRRRPPLAPLLGTIAMLSIGPLGVRHVAHSPPWLAFTAWVQS